MLNDLSKKLLALESRPERSRPIWRNIHTGKEVAVRDLVVNDDGGFQGGCRHFVVLLDEPPPPGPPHPNLRGWPGKEWGLGGFLEHWEPTGKFKAVDELGVYD